MMHRGPMTICLAEASRSEVNTGTQSQIAVQHLNKEAEKAIKQLTAEIMDAYGLCRPVETDQHSAKSPSSLRD